jgi:hypothetical protein
MCTNAKGDQMAPHFLFQKGNDKHHLVDTSFSTYDSNASGYQDEITFQSWLNLLILFLRQDDHDPTLLLLDGHFSHLNLDVLFTAEKANIIILCLPAHSTMICQPNNQMTNKTFKSLLDNGLKWMIFSLNHLIFQFLSSWLKYAKCDCYFMEISWNISFWWILNITTFEKVSSERTRWKRKEDIRSSDGFDWTKIQKNEQEKKSFKKLVSAFEKEVENVKIPIPKEISDLIYQPKQKEEKKKLSEFEPEKKIRIHFLNVSNSK